MRVICLAALLASACAFTSQPAPLAGERISDNVVAPGNAHRNRRATIVMDGKANGEFFTYSAVPEPRIRTRYGYATNQTRTRREDKM
jgi:hypothetical protein